jgi:hypothetical protein
MQFQQKRWPQGVTDVFFLVSKHRVHCNLVPVVTGTFNSTSLKVNMSAEACRNFNRETQVWTASSRRYNKEITPKISKPLCDISAFIHCRTKIYLIPLSLLAM